MTDIDRLIDAVEAGTAKVTDFAAAFPKEGFLAAMNAYVGDLNAPKRLHDALLPGWRWQAGQDDKTVYATVYPAHDFMRQFVGYSDIPARAWLLAILKAYRSTL